jgi:hypothetical protein
MKQTEDQGLKRKTNRVPARAEMVIKFSFNKPISDQKRDDKKRGYLFR